MFQYTRLQDLLLYFISYNEKISPNDLAKKFEITTRTLRNDIHNLNEILQSYDLEIIMKRSSGYYFDGTEENIQRLVDDITIEADEQLDSADKRINHLIIKLLYSANYLSMDDLADEVFVSTNTILNYLRTIRIILEPYDLKLCTRSNWGYKIEGNELSKRMCLIDIITSNYNQYALHFSKEQKLLLTNVNLEAIKDIVIAFNHDHNISFSDYNLKNLILHIALSVSRLSSGNSIDHYEIPNDESLFTLLFPLIKIIERTFAISFTKEEMNYIFSHYITNTNDLLNPNNDISYIQNLVENIIDFIFESYHFDLRSDLLLQKDLMHHLHSILIAKCYSLNKRNPLLDTIKKNYILSFEVSETALKHVFNDEPFELTDDEVGYISLHIGAAIERYFDAKQLHQKKAIITYDSGYAVSTFIKSKLNSLFKDKLEIIKSIPSHEITKDDLRNIDFIISTISLPEINFPTVCIQLPFTRTDIETITKYITMEDIHPIDKIAHFFDCDLFIHSDMCSKTEVIHTLSELLKHKGYANDGFEESVLKREESISTVMDGVVATPHPLIMCSSKSKIAIAILDKPIPWSTKDHAQIVLLMALADDSKKYIEKLYDTFVFLMNNPSLQAELLQTTNLSEFLEILKININE